MSYFVKMLGSTDWPMPNDAWSRKRDEFEVRFASKPKPDDVNIGDGLLYYAVGGYKRIFAAAQVESIPEIVDDSNPEVSKRWPYLAKVKLWDSAKLTYVSSGPELNSISRDLQSRIGHGVGYFEIGRDDFERGVKLFQAAKKEEDAKLKRGWRPT
jgi:hypothetical protein